MVDVPAFSVIFVDVDMFHAIPANVVVTVLDPSVIVLTLLLLDVSIPIVTLKFLVSKVPLVTVSVLVPMLSASASSTEPP